MLHKVGSKLKIEAASTAVTDLLIEKQPQDYQVIEKKRSDFLYFRARAISAGDFGPTQGDPNPNGNGDYFPKAELEKSYQTFEGRNLFLNHESDHPVKSVGKVVSAELIDDPETGEIYVECLSKIDKKLHPEIARKVETGELDTVSMGCSCEKSQCSICGHILESDEDEKCAHLQPSGLLKSYSAEIDLPEYGIQRGKPAKAFAINTGLVFNELSIVNVPADAQAMIKGIIASNIKTKISKKASLDETERSHLNELLSRLDEPTKNQIKAEFCGICPPSQEEQSMSEKSKSNGDKVVEEKTTTVQSRNEKDEMKEMLSGLDAFKYHKLAEMFEKKFKKAEEEVQTEAKDTKKKPDKDKDGVPDWADKHPGKDDHKKKEEASLREKILQKAENSMAGKLFAQTIRRLLNAETEKKSKSVITAKFTKKDDLKSSTWTIAEEGSTKPLIIATLNDIWGEELEAQDQKAITGEEYAKDLLSFYSTEGVEKTAILLGVKAYEQMNVGKPKEVKTPGKQEFKVEHEAKEEKAAEKSSEAVGKDEMEVGKHLEPEKKIQEASEVKKDVKKKAEQCEKCDCPVAECKCKPAEKEADMAGEVPKEMEAPMAEEPAPEMHEENPEAPKEDSTLFDEIDMVDLGDGYKAKKDLESKEVVITDAQEQEVKRIPDAFGHDMPAAIDLLREVMGLGSAEKQEEAPAPVTDMKEEPAAEEPAAEPTPDDAGMYASKTKNKVSKEAEELQKEKEALEQEKRALEAKKAEVIAAQFGTSVNTRVAKCRDIVEAMNEREMLQIDEDKYEEALENGATVIEARNAARKHSISRQLENLLAMDETSLDAFAKTVTRVQKKASKGTLKTAVHMAYPEDKEDDVSAIFDSMGSGGGRSKFDV